MSSSYKIFKKRIQELHKNISKNFFGYLLSFSLGSLTLIYLDIWVIKKTEPATFTATASTITLCLAISALAKVKKWLKVKKSEKAFERTSLFIEAYFNLARYSGLLNKSITNYDPEYAKQDPFMDGIIIKEAQSYWDKSEELMNNAISISASFHVWSIDFYHRELFEKIISEHSAFHNYAGAMLSSISDPSFNDLSKELWIKHAKIASEHHERFESLISEFIEYEYDDMFHIEKK